MSSNNTPIIGRDEGPTTPSNDELLGAALQNLIFAAHLRDQVVKASLGQIDVNAGLAISAGYSNAMQAYALCRIAVALELPENWRPQ